MLGTYVIARALRTVSFSIAFAGAAVAAQTGAERGTRPSMSRAWAAYERGDWTNAAAEAGRIMSLNAADHDAAGLRLKALSRVPDAGAALDTYEVWLTAYRVEDLSLMERVAVAHLASLAAENADSALQVAALAALARNGDASARQHLESDGTVTALLARASLGDAAALDELIKVVDDPQFRNKPLIAPTLQHAGSASLPALVKMSRDRAPLTRVAAAEALGSLESADAVESLRALLDDTDPLVRNTAILALARSGDTGALEQAKLMLKSDVADVRVMAARVLKSINGDDRAWATAVKPLLEDMNGLTRLHAAELLAQVDPSTALETLVLAWNDPNPAIREETARILSQTGLADLRLLRRILRDGEGWSRLYAAEAVLRNFRFDKRSRPAYPVVPPPNLR